MDGVEREVVEWRKEFITFHENEITKTISETTGNFPIIDRVTGYYSQKNTALLQKVQNFRHEKTISNRLKSSLKIFSADKKKGSKNCPF